MLTNKRQTYNNKILNIIKLYLEKYPDIRFVQALYNLNILNNNDYYNEEPYRTYNRIKTYPEIKNDNTDNNLTSFNVDNTNTINIINKNYVDTIFKNISNITDKRNNIIIKLYNYLEQLYDSTYYKLYFRKFLQSDEFLNMKINYFNNIKYENYPNDLYFEYHMDIINKLFNKIYYELYFKDKFDEELLTKIFNIDKNNIIKLSLYTNGVLSYHGSLKDEYDYKLKYNLFNINTNVKLDILKTITDKNKLNTIIDMYENLINIYPKIQSDIYAKTNFL